MKDYLTLLPLVASRDIEADLGALDVPEDGRLAGPTELVAELMTQVEASASVLQAAERAFKEVRRLEVGPDYWDERRELLCQLSFVAWRNALALDRYDQASHWWVEFHAQLQSSWVGLEAYDCIADSSAVDDSIGATQLDSLGLLSLSGWIRVAVNKHPSFCIDIARRCHSLIQSGDVLFLGVAEQVAQSSDFLFLEALSQRMAGQTAIGMDMLRALFSRSDLSQIVPSLVREWEAEVIAGLYEIGEFEAAIECGLDFLSKHGANCPKRPQLKVKLGVGMSMGLLGRHAESAAVLDEVARDPWCARQPVFALAARQNLGSALMQCGMEVAGLAQLRRAARLARGYRETPSGCTFDLYKAEAQWIAGDLTGCARTIAAFIERVDATELARWSDYGRVLLGVVLQELDHPHEARHILREALDKLATRGITLEAAAALQLLGNLENGRPSKRTNAVRPHHGTVEKRTR
jgi:hypothetical protein